MFSWATNKLVVSVIPWPTPVTRNSLLLYGRGLARGVARGEAPGHSRSDHCKSIPRMPASPKLALLLQGQEKFIPTSFAGPRPKPSEVTIPHVDFRLVGFQRVYLSKLMKWDKDGGEQSRKPGIYPIHVAVSRNSTSIMLLPMHARWLRPIASRKRPMW